MGLAAKLNLKDGMKLLVVGKPAAVDLGDVVVTKSASADGVLVFVASLSEVVRKAAPAITAAREDRIAWIAYPKGGQLGTDINRDVLWKHLLKQGIQGVRQIAIDEVWSALRFRPASE